MVSSIDDIFVERGASRIVDREFKISSHQRYLDHVVVQGMIPR